jgi:cytochrome c biogenesis protein CcmG, thiol:disulfide interchange protein DsbE
MKRGVILWVPLLLFLALAGWFIHGLRKPETREIRSQMVGKPLPSFSLPAAASDRPALASADMAGGKPRLLNIFASWCVPCAAESAQLLELRRAGVEIDGVAIRDAREDVDRFLSRWGNPYTRIGLDARSEVQLAIGSSGVPETFIIDSRGRIAHQHIGDIRAEDVADILARLKAVQ